MKKTFKKIKADEGKLNVELLHDYYPIKDNNEVYVEVEHLRNGDIFNCVDPVTRDIDFSKIFLKKCKAVHGVTIEVADGVERDAAPQDIVNIPDTDFSTIVISTAAHLLEGMNLTEDESKN